MYNRLAASDGRVADLEIEVLELKSKALSATPILANARLDERVRALSEELQRAQERTAAAEREAARCVEMDGSQCFNHLIMRTVP